VAGAFCLAASLVSGQPAHPPAKTRSETSAAAQPPGQPPAAAEAGYPVIYRGQEVWRVYGSVGPFTAEDRARGASARLEEVVKDLTFDPARLAVVHRETVSEFVIGERVLGVVTEGDAAGAGMERRAYADAMLGRIRDVVTRTREEFTPRAVALGAMQALAASLVLVVALWGSRNLSRRARLRLTRWSEEAVRIQRAELVSRDRAAALARAVVRLSAVVLTLVALGIWLEVVLHALPWTRPYARVVLEWVGTPLAVIWTSFLAFLPNLFFILVIAGLTYAVLRVVRVFFGEIERGNIGFETFPAEWAEPTYKIVRILAIALAFVAAFPYIPGSQSPAFQGVSIFLGLLFSLSSSSAIANVVAGTILTYTRSFRVGDRVRIGDTTGDVVRKSMLVTHVRTIKNVIVSIPNAVVLSNVVVNYAALAKADGLILHTSVTIGYDAPWRTVHELLINAALNTPGIEKEPKPFVLQTSLNDFFVSYEINAYTRDPWAMVQIYSDLHAQIQESFNRGGVEIMSPHYYSLRDGNTVTIPGAHRPADYEAPSFRVTTSDGEPRRG
jgi:small-conductance mechanosensitive channel